VFLSGSQAHEAEIFSLDDAGQLSATFDEPVPGLYSTFIGAHAGDVTGDGRPDLLLFESVRGPGGLSLESLPVLLLSNAGDGTLATPVPLVEELGGVSFESTDFDGDEKPDLMLVSEQDRVQLARGDGLGHYTTTAEFSGGPRIFRTDC
jgi:hypothetical protein